MGSRGGQGQNQSQPEERWRVRINYRRCESVQAGGLLVSEGLMPIWRYWKHVSQLARLHGGFPTLSFIWERHIISFHSRPLYFPQHRPTPIWSVLVFFSHPSAAIFLHRCTYANVFRLFWLLRVVLRPPTLQTLSHLSKSPGKHKKSECAVGEGSPCLAAEFQFWNLTNSPTTRSIYFILLY